MELLLQIFLLVAISYLTLTLAVKTMFGEYTSLFSIMATILVTCFVVLAQTLQLQSIYALNDYTTCT